MLQKRYRLKTNDIKFVAFKGKKISSELFDLRIWTDNNLPNPVMTISISTKISKKAHVRNRIKRLFREAFRNLIEEKKLKLGKYLVVVKSAKLEEMKSGEVKELVAGLLK